MIVVLSVIVIGTILIFYVMNSFWHIKTFSSFVAGILITSITLHLLYTASSLSLEAELLLGVYLYFSAFVLVMYAISRIGRDVY